MRAFSSHEHDVLQLLVATHWYHVFIVIGQCKSENHFCSEFSPLGTLLQVLQHFHYFTGPVDHLPLYTECRR